MTAPRPVTPVGILAATLAEIVDRLDASGGAVDDDTRTRLRAALDLASGLEPYVSEMSTPRSPALAEIERRTNAADWSRSDGVFLEQEMLSGHAEGQLLKMLVHATGARRVLEIGMFTGYSALAMAEALPSGGTLVACELDAAVAEFAREGFRASPAGDRIEVRIGPAIETLAALRAAGQRFDMVFIDADKAGYQSYLDAVLDGDLLAPGGLICVDNTLLQGEPYAGGPRGDNGAAIAAFNRSVAADARLEQVIVPMRDGLTLIRRGDQE